MLKQANKTLEIKDHLAYALSQIKPFNQCILLDHPDHYNIGDHLIWLGAVSAIQEKFHAHIRYTSGIRNIDYSRIEEHENCPIIFNGRGALGDLYEDYQLFRESIISKYTNRQVIILPQTIYFRNSEKLRKTAKVFNSHPDLTLLCRDKISFRIAQENFSKCHSILSPDMAFWLTDLPMDQVEPKQNKRVLFLCRKDKEYLSSFDNFDRLMNDIPGIVIEDWVSEEKWILRNTKQLSKAWYWKIPGFTWMGRELYQRLLCNPSEWFSREHWKNKNIMRFSQDYLSRFGITGTSLGLMHSGIYQFNQYDLIITNRLHGHILSCLLNIPNILLPNSYYKNQIFFESWTGNLPFCKFVENYDELPKVIEMLLEEAKLKSNIFQD